MTGWTDDPYFKNRLTLLLKQGQFQFDTAALLFSPHEIDAGTTLLLETVIELSEKGKSGQPKIILEVGCNYGAIGITLAKLYPKAQVLLCDKDLLAVRYARHNAALNEATNVEVLGSIGVENVPPQSCDWIVASVPTKIGDRAIEHDFLLRPLERLAPGGSYWLVAESSLNRLLPGLGRRHKLPLVEVDREAGHILYRIKKGF